MDWHPFAEKFPLLEGEEWEEFKVGVKKTGGVKSDPVLYRVLPDDSIQGLDGRNRHRACKELRIKCDMKKVTVPDEEVINFILQKNVQRRHLATDFRRVLVAELRAEGESTREIAEQLKVDPKTVRNDLKANLQSQVGTDSPPEQIVGKDGKQYPATRGDADESPILCARCARIGTEDPRGCEKCKAEREKANRKKAERSTSKRKQGQVIFDVKGFNDAYGYFLRQIDKIGRPFKEHNSVQAEKFRGEIESLKNRILAWQRSLANVRKP